MRRLVRVWGLASALALTAPAWAEGGTVPDAETLEADGAVIGEVVIRAREIFDPEAPGEDNAIFRAANALHVRTRDEVIRRHLLFAPGDLYSRRLVDESERILRSTGYLYEAQIRPVRYESGRVDLEVATRDVWTLQLGLSLGRGGGENAFGFGIQDSNFFGTGKDLTVQRSSDVDRTETLFRYRDPALLGTRGRLALAYSDNSDGNEAGIALERPFYSLDTRWAMGASASDAERVESMYEAGEIASQFRRFARRLEVHGGHSAGVASGRSTRLLYGYSFQEDRFEPVAGAPPPAEFPVDRVLSYPWIGFEQIHDRFIEVRDFDRLDRTEDLNLGRVVRARLGYSATALGGDVNQALFSAGLTQGFSLGIGQILQVEADLEGRWAERPENTIAGGGFRYDRRIWGGHVFHVAFRADAATRLDPDRQLLLGGDSGLRGYPLRYAEGDRRMLLTVEQRFYSSLHLFRLIHVGGAVFYDAGNAWYAGDPAARDQGLLQDVGIGLRLSSSRSSAGSMLKLDLAFPIDPPAGVRSPQFVVSGGSTF
jgi:hypothetical protein